MNICLRFFESSKNVKEAFLGFTPATDGQDAASPSAKIVEGLTKNKVDLGSCVGQCYNGASVMPGKFHGMQAVMRQDMPNAIYVHCSSHRLNLVVVDVITGSTRIVELLDTLKQLHSFMTISAVQTIIAKQELYSGQHTRELPAFSDTR